MTRKLSISTPMKYSLSKYLNQSNAEKVISLLIDFVDEIAFEVDKDGYVHLGFKGEQLSVLLNKLKEE